MLLFDTEVEDEFSRYIEARFGVRGAEQQNQNSLDNRSAFN